MLNLYRRHHRTADKCIGAHKPDSRSYEGDEKRRGWKKCECPIYASGTLDRFHRKNTDQVTWDAALIQARVWEDAGNWDGLPPTRTLLTPAQFAEIDPSRKTIAYALDRYIEEHRNAGSAELTIARYREQTRAFQRFSDLRGYIYLDQWTTTDVRDMRDSWTNVASTRKLKLGWLGTFFRFAVSQDWIDSSPVTKVVMKGIGKNKAIVGGQKAPFTDDELQRIFRACHRLPGSGPTKNRFGSWGGWSGPDIYEFIAVAVYTGLRISDMVLFRATRMDARGVVFLRQHKTKKPLLTSVPLWVQEIIRDRARRFGDQIFLQRSNESAKMKSKTEVWRRQIGNVFKLAAQEVPFTSKPTPHRFRHTFVRILLQAGIRIQTVAELAGDTEATIRTYYADWCKERQNEVINELTQAFANQTRPAAADSPAA